jgi:hypothetical protein
MNRRQALTTVGLGAVGLVVAGAGPPACGISKDKAVRIADLVINLSKESLPLLELMGARDIAQLVSTKAIPTLEKLKDYLSKTDIPQATSTLETVRNVFKGIGDALLNLPDTARRTTIIGILASINVLLLTVEACVESETTVTVVTIESTLSAADENKLLKVFQATRN